MYMRTVLRVGKPIFFIVLRIYTFLNVFTGSMFSFCQCRNQNSSPISHTRPLRSQCWCQHSQGNVHPLRVESVVSVPRHKNSTVWTSLRLVFCRDFSFWPRLEPKVRLIAFSRLMRFLRNNVKTHSSVRFDNELDVGTLPPTSGVHLLDNILPVFRTIGKLGKKTNQLHFTLCWVLFVFPPCLLNSASLNGRVEIFVMVGNFPRSPLSALPAGSPLPAWGRVLRAGGVC